jgi:hypothetical protein
VGAGKAFSGRNIGLVGIDPAKGYLSSNRIKGANLHKVSGYDTMAITLLYHKQTSRHLCQKVEFLEVESG